MNELQCMTIGKVKMNKTQRRKKRYVNLSIFIKVIAAATFVAGILCGLFIGIYI